MKKLIIAIILLCIFTGIMFRLYHIEFGLPHSFYADEPEIAELAIKYTYEFRNIIKNNDYYKFIPVSFVYGAFPSYMNTMALMLFSKTSNLLGIAFDKTTLYIFLRSFNALLSMVIVITSGWLTHKLFKNTTATLFAIFLTALNWKFIVHAHYINADITQTILLSLSYLSFYYYYKKENDTKFTVITGILFGLAAATKITTLICIPLYFYIFMCKKDYRGLVAFSFIAFGTFILGNPFSMILANTFAFRVLSMFSKEGGIVFDSVNNNPFKYFISLFKISTPLVLLFSLYGKLVSYKIFRKESAFKFHVFLMLNILVYLGFFSLQKRLVDRWLLPVIPIVLIYASYGISSLYKINRDKIVTTIITLLLLIGYLSFPILLLGQFKKDTPKSSSYLWLRDNIGARKKILAYTEEGLDPLYKLPNAKVFKVEVYSNDSAQFFLPDNPYYYDYVVISSRPMENYKKPEIVSKYPFYHEKWEAFEKIILDQESFVMEKEFVLPKPNLIPLSDVFIYKNLKPALVLEKKAL